MSAAPELADGFLRACAVDDIPATNALHVDLAGRPVAVVRAATGIYAIADVCSHADVALSEGDVDDDTIECWLHGSRFDLRTGRPTGLPATRPVAVYPTRVEGGVVYVSPQES